MDCLCMSQSTASCGIKQPYISAIETSASMNISTDCYWHEPCGPDFLKAQTGEHKANGAAVPAEKLSPCSNNKSLCLCTTPIRVSAKTPQHSLESSLQLNYHFSADSMPRVAPHYDLHQFHIRACQKVCLYHFLLQLLLQASLSAREAEASKEPKSRRRGVYTWLCL